MYKIDSRGGGVQKSFPRTDPNKSPPPHEKMQIRTRAHFIGFPRPRVENYSLKKCTLSVRL